MAVEAAVGVTVEVTAGRRIGLLGGSFDPVHLTHRQLADAALAQLQLDELRWVVAGQPWQKARQLAPAADRAAMVALAIADEPRYRLETCELNRTGPSYTLDTVTELQSRWAKASGGRGCQWFLILGQDQYANFPTWHGWPQLLGLVTLAVTARNGQAVVTPHDLAAVPHRLETLLMPASPTSATAIRARLSAGESAAALAGSMLAEPVAAYIDSHRLYHPPLAASRAPH